MLRMIRNFSILILVCTLSVAPLHAQIVSNTVHYSGILTERTTGDPVVDGTYSVTFRLYPAQTGEPETALWAEEWSSAVSSPITTVQGYYFVLLGSHIPFPKGLFENPQQMYLGITVQGSPELLPRQQISSVPTALAAQNGVPIGGIIMWSGMEIPAGWALCDGTNGTPDLRNRFIRGAANFEEIYLPTTAPNSTGGTSSHTHNISANKNATINSGYAGNHNHRVRKDLYSHIGDTSDGADDGGKSVGSNDHGHRLDVYADTRGNHRHAIGGHTHSGAAADKSHLPLYYVLAFIMRVPESPARVLTKFGT